MGLVEMKELIKTLVADAFILILVVYAILHIFARITYKNAHKNVKKVHKKASKNVNVVFDIDSKGKTLQEVQFERNQMIKNLGGI